MSYTPSSAALDRIDRNATGAATGVALLWRRLGLVSPDGLVEIMMTAVRR